MGISIFLLIYDFAQVEVAKVGLLGTELLVGKPIVLVGFAWTLWAYFLFRYIQYFKDEAERSGSVSAFFLKFLRLEIEQQTLNTARRSYGDEVISAEISTDGIISSTSLTWLVDIFEGPPSDESYKGKTKIDQVTLQKPIVVYYYLRAGLKFALRSTVFSDRVIPYLLAFSVPVVSVSISLMRQP